MENAFDSEMLERIAHNARRVSKTWHAYTDAQQVLTHQVMKLPHEEWARLYDDFSREAALYLGRMMAYDSVLEMAQYPEHNHSAPGARNETVYKRCLQDIRQAMRGGK